MRVWLGVLVGIVLVAGLAPGWVPVDEICEYRLWVVEDGDSVATPYESSHDLSGAYPEITRIVMNLHGSNRRGTDAMEKIEMAMEYHDRNLDHVLYCAPQFLFDDDFVAHEPTDTLFWWGNIYEVGPEWNYGHESKTNPPYPRPFSRSSFALMDSLALKALRAAPNATTVVFAGMSAGGKTIQHYAVASQLDQQIEQDVVFVSIAPAHHVYIGPERPLLPEVVEFEIPSPQEIADCPDYDYWPFGINAPYPYFAEVPYDTLRERFFRRTYLQVIGEEDTTGFPGSNQNSCHATLQGTIHRLQRLTGWWNHLVWTYGSVPPGFEYDIEEGLGHQGTLYRRERVRYHLFDHFAWLAADETVEITPSLQVDNSEPSELVLEYEWSVSNGGDETRRGDVWLELVSNVDASRITAWQESYLIGPGFSEGAADASMTVPDDFPEGEATLYLNVGVYPDVVTTFASRDVYLDTSSIRPLQPTQYQVSRLVSLGPNPFNSSTSLHVELPHRTKLRVQLFDIQGRRVALPVNREYNAGSHTISVNGSGLSTGIYFARIWSGDGMNETRKLLLLR